MQHEDDSNIMIICNKDDNEDGNEKINYVRIHRTAGDEYIIKKSVLYERLKTTVAVD